MKSALQDGLKSRSSNRTNGAGMHGANDSTIGSTAVGQNMMMDNR